MRSESQVELSLAEQRLIKNSTSLLFLRALAGQRGGVSHSYKPGPSPGRLSFLQCLTALGGLQDQMVTACAFQTPCSRRARLLRVLTIECLEQLTVIDATDVNETFLSQLAHAGSLELFQFMIVAPCFEKQCAPLELDNTILKWPKASLSHSSLRG